MIPEIFKFSRSTVRAANTLEMTVGRNVAFVVAGTLGGVFGSTEEVRVFEKEDFSAQRCCPIPSNCVRLRQNSKPLIALGNAQPIKGLQDYAKRLF
jgi:hypothetical protein